MLVAALNQEERRAGEEDEDNDVARTALRRLDAYRDAAAPVLDTLGSATLDTVRQARESLQAAQRELAAVDAAVARIVETVAKVVG